MKRLLIVDDEPFIVNGLYEYMLLGSGLELDVYKAFSGDEAMEWLQRTKMDIVISDIRMPAMSGLQLLEQIRKRWPHCKVILLTGYNEFDYVYQAIRYDGVRYMLKTEGYDKLLELVRSAVAEIDEARKSEDLVATAQRQMKLALPIMQKDMLLAILRGERYTSEQRASQFRQLGLSLDGEREVFLILGRLDCTDRAEGAFRVKMAVERYMGSAYEAAFLTGEDAMLVWIVQPAIGGEADNENEEGDGVVPQLKGNLELALEMCEETFGLSVHFIVDGQSVSWDRAAGRYAALRTECGSLPDIGGRGSIIEYSSAKPSRPVALESETLESAVRQIKRMDLLGSFLESGRKDEFLELLEELLQSAEQATESRLLHAALSIYYPLSLLLLSHIHAWRMEERMNEVDGIHTQAIRDPALSPNQAAGSFRFIAPLLFEWRQNAQISHAHSAISHVQDYLLANLDKDLSLVRLAEVSRLNPSYLSRLFKQVTGVNLNVYIQEARLDKAMELLRDSEFKVYEIARLVGYEYAPYFTKIFKKHVGMNPQEYRDRHSNNVNKL
ncbi:response regulator transcription factor [Cohnella soli]|uniref:Response regulator n=1 Tax=Cohnella soli TaxID=425005 RepID=A0ABW0HT24_9BACL